VTETLGPYELVRLIGKGGMGEVHLARDTRLDREVALKLLPPTLADDPDRRARFLREARAAASLNHPNITTTLDVGEENGRDYIAQELVEGQPLSEIVTERKLPLDELAGLAVPLADALTYAHGRGVIHRDLKASNVIVNERGDPKLLDFGLAKMLGEGALPDEQSTTLTISGAVFGTPGAMSPEQALGKTVDARGDVFSFGSLLYEMATGKPAFLGTTVQETLNKVLNSEPESLAVLRKDLPSDFTAIVQKALRKEPDERYQSMADLAADLRHFQRRTDSGLVPPASPRRPSYFGRIVALTALVLVLVVGALFVFTGGSATPGGDGTQLVGVMYFENLADPEDVSHQGTMLTRLLDNELSAVTGLEVLSQQRLFDIAKQLGGGEGMIGRGTASDVAREAGLSTMIVGELTSIGSRLVARASLIDVGSGRTIVSHQVEGASEDDFFTMARSLGEQARGTLLAEGSEGTAAPLTESVEALRAYVLGEDLLRQGNFASATASFGVAAGLDPRFAMAHFRQAIAGIWRSSRAENLRAIDKAIQHADRLPASMRPVLDVARLFIQGRYGELLPLLTPLIAEDPYNKDLLYILGEVRTHSSAANDSAAAAEAFERVLELDPHFGLVYEHLVSAYLRDQRWDDAARWLDELAETNPERAEELRGDMVRAYGPHPGWPEAPPYTPRNYDDVSASGTTPLMAELLAEDWALLDDVLGKPIDEVLAWLDEALAGAWEGNRMFWFYCVALVETHRGAFARARRVTQHVLGLETLPDNDNMDGNVLAELIRLHAQLALLAGDHEEVRAALDQARAQRTNSPRPLHMEVTLSLRLGDEDRAQRALDDLDRLAAKRLSPMTRFYQEAAHAERDLHRGEVGSARRALERVVEEAPPHGEFYVGGGSGHPLFLHALARARLADGDADGAASALREMVEPNHLRTTQPLVWLPALAELGRMEWDAGNEAEGRARLEQFLEYWGDADLDLPEVADARARLAGS